MSPAMDKRDLQQIKLSVEHCLSQLERLTVKVTLLEERLNRECARMSCEPQ